MKNRQTDAIKVKNDPIQASAVDSFPGPDTLAALRAWYQGLSATESVTRYLPERTKGTSARGVIGKLRRHLIRYALQRHRADLADVFQHPESERRSHAKAAGQAIETLRTLQPPQPLIGDSISEWLTPRAVRALEAQGIHTLAALTVRIPRLKRWWARIPGLGLAGARHIEAFFKQHPELIERAQTVIAVHDHQDIIPWEHLCVPAQFDGSQGSFRAPRNTCALSANNDYEAVQTWLSLHEAMATQRAYRKEAERLILWAVIEQGKALSSLTTEDALAYRSFLRHPSPSARWVGPACPRHSPQWRPFSGGLSPRSVAYSLSVLGALFRWLIEQRYVLANPFAGIKVRGASRSESSMAARVFNEGEWLLIQTIAEGLEWSHGWPAAAAQRLRFVLDFAYATGLRASELVGARLGQIETDSYGNHWLALVGKGNKAAKVGLPPMAHKALIRYLVQRGLPSSPDRCATTIPLLGRLDEEDQSGISSARLWHVMRRFFRTAAQIIADRSPSTAEKLRQASPHWMRHTHATHALARGVELTTVRDNLRHASLSTTSIYLHTDDVKRAGQLSSAFGDKPKE